MGRATNLGQEETTPVFRTTVYGRTPPDYSWLWLLLIALGIVVVVR